MEIATPSFLQEQYRLRGSWPAVTLAGETIRHADSSPDRIAVVDTVDDRAVPYAQLVDDASRLAAWMRDHGIAAGDGISVQLPNRYETVIVDLATLMLGARLNPLLPNYRHRELRHILTTSKAKLLVTPRRYRDFDYAALANRLLADVPTLDHHLIVDTADTRQDVGPTSLREILDEQVEGLHSCEPDPSSVSELIFTSGTESAPKAVMHTEETLNHSVRATYKHLDMSDQDVVYMPSPVGHSTGLNFGIRMALLHGLTLVLQDRWDGAYAARVVERYGCTYVLSATTFLADLIAAAIRDGRDVSSLSLFGCGGAPVPPELVREAGESGVRVLRLYGSTEGLIISWNRPDSSEDQRLHTDGLSMDETEIRVVDDDGGLLPTGSPGELVIRGPNVCVGFFDDPSRNASAFDADGWLRTGDRGVLDDEGHVTIVGRKKEIIIRGGMNLAPREIEEVLSELEGVSDVAVIGLPDERLGEIVCGCLVLEPKANAPSLDDVARHLTDRGLARYKVPERLVVVPSLPRTPTGKVQKGQLLERVVGDGAR